ARAASTDNASTMALQASVTASIRRPNIAPLPNRVAARLDRRTRSPHPPIKQLYPIGCRPAMQSHRARISAEAHLISALTRHSVHRLKGLHYCAFIALGRQFEGNGRNPLRKRIAIQV